MQLKPEYSESMPAHAEFIGNAWRNNGYNGDKTPISIWFVDGLAIGRWACGAFRLTGSRYADSSELRYYLAEGKNLSAGVRNIHGLMMA